jgi:small subunit ribosomal protein S6e
MAEFKLVIGDPKSGKCYQRDVKDTEAKPFLGKAIGDKIGGEAFGLKGYEFEITGGSDYCGFPMRKDVIGPQRGRILATKSTGIKQVSKGIRVRKTLAGNTIHTKTAQINLKVLKAGAAQLEPAKQEGE